MLEQRAVVVERAGHDEPERVRVDRRHARGGGRGERQQLGSGDRARCEIGLDGLLELGFDGLLDLGLDGLLELGFPVFDVVRSWRDDRRRQWDDHAVGMLRRGEHGRGEPGVHR